MNRSTPILIGMYLAAIVAANLTVAYFGAGVAIVNAFVFIALDLTSGDRLHEAWHGRGLAWKMALLILAGSGLSYALNMGAGPVALASLAAFGVAASLDRLCYQLLGQRSYLVKVNGSNLVSAAADSAIFLSVLAGLGGLPWALVPALALGQFVAKVLGGALWAWLLQPRAKELA